MASKSSQRWLDEHFSDQYVKRSQQDGYRSRAAYKLLELDDKDQLLRGGMTVVDLGAAPGGWSQVAAERVGDHGRVVALDILAMDALAGVEVIEGDFREDSVLAQLLERNVSPCDLVMSDMAPNMSGVKVADQASAMYLAELALAFSQEHLKPGANMVVKVFQGAGFDEYGRDMRASFDKVVVRKPGASRSRSREVYLVGLGRR